MATTDPAPGDTREELVRKIVIRSRALWAVTADDSNPNTGEPMHALHLKWLLALNEAP